MTKLAKTECSSGGARGLCVSVFRLLDHAVKRDVFSTITKEPGRGSICLSVSTICRCMVTENPGFFKSR
jgi:hypothetical protein